MFVGFAVSAIALAGAFWILNSQLIQKNGERAAVLNDYAVAAVEEGRSKLNAHPAIYPTTGYAQLDTNAVVKDGAGVVIPGLRKNTYAGPDGITSGQYGVFGTIITVVTDSFGNKVVRREQVNQESFAKYAYFTTIEGNIVFAHNDQIRGPVHSNDQIKIDATGATFFDQVSYRREQHSGPELRDVRELPTEAQRACHSAADDAGVFRAPDPRQQRWHVLRRQHERQQRG